MPTEIDSLQIKIQANSANAATGIDKLVKSLEALKGALKGGAGLGGLESVSSTLKTASKNLGANVGSVTAMTNALKEFGKLKNVKLPTGLSTQLSEIGKASGAIGSNIGQRLSSLAKGLESLKSASDVKISSTVGSGIASVNTALSQLNVNNLPKIERVSTALSSLNGIKDVRISSSIGKNLVEIAVAAEQIKDVEFSPVSRLAEALTPLTNLGTVHLGSIFNQLSRLPEIFETLKGTDLDGFAETIQKLSAALSPLATRLDGIGNSFSKLPSQVSKVAGSTTQLVSTNRAAVGSYTELLSAAKLAYAAARGVGTKIANWINKSNEYIEDLNLFNASMGKYTQAAKDYADTVEKAVGIDPGQWMRNQGVFMTLATGFGVAGDRAYVMSQQLTQLGYDLSSFFNLPFEESMQKLQSGISGELEPLRRLGYDLSQARLKAVALDLGITKTFNDMTQAEKAQLRYYAIMTQVTNSHGDMARTLSAPSNQLRVLQSQVTQAARAFGNVFIPVLNAVLPVCIAVAKAIRMVAAAIAGLFGFSLPSVDYSGIGAGLDDVGAGLGEIGDQAERAGGAAKKLKTYLMGFDELNIIEPDDNKSGGGGGGGGGVDSSAWDWDLPVYDFLDGLVESSVGQWMAKMQPAIDWITEHLREILAIAGAVGAELLMWKLAKKLIPDLSSALTDMKGILAVAAALATAVVTVALVYKFNNEYLETGKFGFLIADGITTALGSAIIGKVIAGNFGAQAGWYAASAMVAISAGISMGLAIKDIYNKGITENNVKLLILGVLKGTLAGLLATRTVTGALIGFGISATLALTLVSATLTAKEGLTWKVFGTTAAASAVSGLVTKHFATALGMTSVSAFLTGFALTAAVSLTVNQGIVAAKEGMTWSVMGTSAAASMASAIVALKLAPKLGLTSIQGLGLGFGIGLVANFTIDTLAVAANPKITADQKALDIAKGSVITALGAGLIAVGLGATLATGAVIGVAGGLALAAIATLVSVSVKKGNILQQVAQWGTIAASATELKTKIESMFAFDITATAKLVETTITDADTAKAQLNESIASFQSELNSVTISAKLGDPETLTDLQAQYSALVSDFQAAIDAGSEVIKLGTALAPPVDGDGNPLDAAGILKSFNLTEGAFSEVMGGLGDEISSLLVKGIEEGLTSREQEVLSELMLWTSRIEAAYARGQASGEFMSNVELILSDLDRESFAAGVEEFKKLKDELTEIGTQTAKGEYTEMNAQIAAYEETINALTAMNREIPESLTEGLEGLRKTFGEFDLQGTIDRFVNENVAPAKEKFISGVHDVFDGVLSTVAEQRPFTALVEDIEFGIFDDMSDFDLTTYKDGAQRRIEEALREALGKDYNIVMNVAGMFDMTGWDLLGAEVQTEIYNLFVSAWGSERTKEVFASLGYDLSNAVTDGIKSGTPEVGKLGWRFTGELVSGIKSGTPEVEKAAEEIAEAVEKSTEEAAKRSHGAGAVFNDLGWSLTGELASGITNSVADEHRAITDAFGQVYDAAEEEYECSGSGSSGSGSRKFKSLGEGIVTGLLTGLNTVNSRLQTTWTNVPAWFLSMTGKIKSTFSAMETDVGALFASMFTGAENAWSGADGWFGQNVISPLSARFLTLKENVVSYFESAKTDAQDQWGTQNRWFSDNVTGPLTNGFTALKASITDSFSAAKADTTDVWSTVSDWFQNNVKAPIVNALTNGDFKTSGSTAAGHLKDGLASVELPVLKPAVELIKSGWETVSGWVSGLMGNTLIQQGASLIRSGWETVSAWVSGLMGNTAVSQGVGLSSAWKSVSEWVSGKMGSTSVNQGVGLLASGWSSVSSWVSGLSGSTAVTQSVGLSSSWESVSKWVSGKMGSTSINQAVGLTNSSAWSTVSSWVSNQIGTTDVSVKASLVKDTNNWATLPESKTITITAKLVKQSGNSISWTFDKKAAPNGTETVTLKAAGGLVEAGQMFVAREAGPELVGSIGNRTAVANNDQIVESVSSGVRSANDGVIAAIYTLIQAVEEKDTSVIIGDDEIGRANDRYKRKRGLNVNTGAFANSY